MEIDSYLDKSDFFGIAAEALSATVQSILPDQPVGVTTNTATYKQIICKITKSES